MREWWNWQTHHLEGVAPVRACEFKSRLAHTDPVETPRKKVGKGDFPMFVLDFEV